MKIVDYWQFYGNYFLRLASKIYTQTKKQKCFKGENDSCHDHECEKESVYKFH